MIKERALEDLWGIFDFAWGVASSDETAFRFDSLLAIEDGDLDTDDEGGAPNNADGNNTPEVPIPASQTLGEVPATQVSGDENEDDEEEIPKSCMYGDDTLEDESSVTTTVPEQTAEEDPFLIKYGVPADEWKKFEKENPYLALNGDGTQPLEPSPSPPPVVSQEPNPSSSVGAPAESLMGPPAPVSPITAQRKREIKIRLEELR